MELKGVLTSGSQRMFDEGSSGGWCQNEAMEGTNGESSSHLIGYRSNAAAVAADENAETANRQPMDGDRQERKTRT